MYAPCRLINIDSSGGKRMESRYLKPEQASELICVSEKFLEKRRRTGDGPPFIRISRNLVRYEREKLEKWMQEQTYENTAQYEE